LGQQGSKLSAPLPPAGPGAPNDPLAAKEAAAVSQKTLAPPDWEAEAAKNQFRRDEWLRNAFFAAATGLIVVGGVILCGFVFTWAWHLMAPECHPKMPCYRWLTDEQESKLQVLLFSGAVASVGSAIVRRILGPPK
jgi:hypothetical protein